MMHVIIISSHHHLQFLKFIIIIKAAGLSITKSRSGAGILLY